MFYWLLAFSSPGCGPGSWLGVPYLTIELSQLYQAPGLNRIRLTTLGGLLLGYIFLWSDLLCYGLGAY